MIAWVLIVAGLLGVLAGMVFGIAIPTERLTSSEAFFARALFILPSFLFGGVMAGMGYIVLRLDALMARRSGIGVPSEGIAPPTHAVSPMPMPVAMPAPAPLAPVARDPVAPVAAPVEPRPYAPLSDARLPVPTPVTPPRAEPKPAPMAAVVAGGAVALGAGVAGLSALATPARAAPAAPEPTPAPPTPEPVPAAPVLDEATRFDRELERRLALDIVPEPAAEVDDDPAPTPKVDAELARGPELVSAALETLPADSPADPVAATIEDVAAELPTLDLGLDLDPEPVPAPVVAEPPADDAPFHFAEADTEAGYTEPAVETAATEAPAPAPTEERQRPPTVEEFIAQDSEAEPPVVPRKVVREGQFAGRRYRMFEDGSLEIDTDQSTLRFDSLEEFRTFVATSSRV